MPSLRILRVRGEQRAKITRPRYGAVIAFTRRTMKLAVFALTLAACTRPLDVPQNASGAAQVACDTITDEATCAARADCVADDCSICGPPFQCISVENANSTCVPGPCVIDCASRKTEADCNAVPSLCHAVYLDPGTCDCDEIDCCLMFDHCAEEIAMCREPPAPPCPANDIVCVDEWATSYSYKNGCVEGCVHTSECNPT